MRGVFVCFLLGGAVVWAWAPVRVDPKPLPREYKVIPVSQIDTDEGYLPTFPQADSEYRHRESREQRLDELGKDGWEASATTPHAWLFSRVRGGPRWEYFVDVRARVTSERSEKRGR
jgi:hypothetical protein